MNILFLDIDGTLTDGKIYCGVEGELFKAFNVKDGYALAHILPTNGIVPIVITGRQSDVVKKRCEELNIGQCYQNIHDKKALMIRLCEENGLYIDECGIIKNTAYIGDDLPDLECMKIVEKSGCPNDAVSEIKKVASFISTRNGGDGAVREFIEWLIKK